MFESWLYNGPIVVLNLAKSSSNEFSSLLAKLVYHSSKLTYLGFMVDNMYIYNTYWEQNGIVMGHQDNDNLCFFWGVKSLNNEPAKNF